MLSLTPEEEVELKQIPLTLWSAGPADVGLMKDTLPISITPKGSHRPYQRQYPLKQEAIEGITPVFESLLKSGVIRPCPDSPCNTPLFPVRKAAPSTGWRMVQDLQAVNKAVIPRAPIVPDPHVLLNDLEPKSKYFSVIDIANAFFSIPVHPDSQFWFCFQFEGKKWTWTRMPQGYCESPTIFSQAMQSNISNFTPPQGSQILLYVNYILLTSETKEQCKVDTSALLQFLAQQGHIVSKNKLQLWKTEVKYLGYNLSQAGRSLDTKRKEAILKAPKPLTKRQMMSFLGMTNFCRAWIPNYAEVANPLSKLIYGEQMSAHDKIKWTTETEEAFVRLKQTLTGSSVLGLPNCEKPFVQTVDCREGFMTSVLTQEHGGKQRPIAFYSSQLDPVAKAMPVCVQAVIAASLAVQASAPVVLFKPLTLKVPHAVSVLLLQSKITFMSPARHLSCMTVLLSQPHLTIERCNTLNPSTLLPTAMDGEPHDCVAETERKVSARQDLTDVPLEDADIVMYVDGSCKKNPDGTTATGYAVVTQDTILKSAPLPSHLSAQAAEIIALTEACKLGKDKKVTIYTDSNYAFSTTHVFAQQWKNRGMVTSTGKTILHKDLILQLLEAIQLPSKIAICKCAAHTKGTDPVSMGNQKADDAAKAAAQIKQHETLITCDISHLNHDILKDMQSTAPPRERATWKTNDAKQDDQGLWR